MVPKSRYNMRLLVSLTELLSQGGRWGDGLCRSYIRRTNGAAVVDKKCHVQLPLGTIYRGMLKQMRESHRIRKLSGDQWAGANDGPLREQ